MALLGSDFLPTDPADSSAVSQGAAYIRDLKQRLKDFVGVSFNPETGAILTEAIPNAVTTPYGEAGTVYTSTGPSSAPVWGATPGIQVGAIMMWPTSTAPTGYLLCQGGTQNIADYPALAALTGTNFGGDGVTTFGIPDLRGRAPVGIGTGDATDATLWVLSQKKGSEGHILVLDEIPSHAHGFKAASNNTSGASGAQAGDSSAIRQETDLTTAYVGGGKAHTSLQPSIALAFIIKT